MRDTRSTERLLEVAEFATTQDYEDRNHPAIQALAVIQEIIYELRKRGDRPRSTDLDERDEALAMLTEQEKITQRVMAERDARINLDDPKVRERIEDLIYAADCDPRTTVSVDAILDALRATQDTP